MSQQTTSPLSPSPVANRPHPSPILLPHTPSESSSCGPNGRLSPIQLNTSSGSPSTSLPNLPHYTSSSSHQHPHPRSVLVNVVEVPPSSVRTPISPSWASGDINNDSSVNGSFRVMGANNHNKGNSIRTAGGSMRTIPTRSSLTGSNSRNTSFVRSTGAGGGGGSSIALSATRQGSMEDSLMGTINTPSILPLSAPAPNTKALKTKTPPSCCTIPIAACFAIACVIIALVFAAITSESIILFRAELSTNIKATLAAGLEGTITTIEGILDQSVVAAKQYKDMIETNPEQFACDDGDITKFPGNESNAGWFYQAGMYSLQQSTVRYIYQTRQSSRYFYPDGTPTPIVCLIDPTNKRLRYFANRTESTVFFDNASGLRDVSSIVAPPMATTFEINTTTIVTDPLNGSGLRWKASAIPTALLQDGNVTAVQTKFSFFLPLKDTPTAAWSLSIEHNMDAVKQVLLRGTPPIGLSNDDIPTQYHGAHTTLYDLVEMVLMSTTHEDVPSVRSDSELWTAGQSPVSEVNEAYQSALAACPLESCTRAVVEVGDGNVRTAYNLVDTSSNLHLFVVSVVPRHHFFGESDQILTITLALAVICCVFVIAGCILLLVLIYRPLASLERNMLMAAELYNDRVDHTPTYLSEIATLSAVFDQMNHQLLIARSFVPEAVLLGKTDDSQDEGNNNGEDNDEFDEGSVVDDDGGGTATEKSYGTANPPTDSSTANHTNVTTTTISSGGMSKLFNIAEKRVGVLSLNVLGFHELCAPDRQTSRAQRIQEMSTALLSLAVGCAHEERGVMDSFHGDHFVLTFNASRAVAGPLGAAIRTANSFIRQTRADGQLRGGGIAAGASSSRAHIGTLGIDGYRRLSVVGEAYRNAVSLQHAAVQFLRMNGVGRGGLREGCLIDESSLREIGSSAFHLQAVGTIQSARHRVQQQSSIVNDNNSKVSSVAYYAIDAHSQDDVHHEDEWLYELDAMEAADPYQEPNQALLALMNGKVEECRDRINTRIVVKARQRAASSSRSLNGEGGAESQSPGVIEPASPVWSSYSLGGGNISNGAIGEEPQQLQHHQQHESDDTPAWAMVYRHMKAYVAELNRLGSAEDPVLLCSKSVPLPWVAFES